eukprot:Seg5812.1 transcript_id=Seg5812.1/GoldUCD/mRNA.D3Y31 product="hypothetical protein" protein_id=Seg5812.1/GoldUCD/D3Y31
MPEFGSGFQFINHCFKLVTVDVSFRVSICQNVLFPIRNRGFFGLVTLNTQARRPTYEEIGNKEEREKEVDFSETSKFEFEIEEEEDLKQTTVEFSNTEQFVIPAFIQWLQSIDGSKKKEKDAKAQARHVVSSEMEAKSSLMILEQY